MTSSRKLLALLTIAGTAVIATFTFFVATYATPAAQNEPPSPDATAMAALTQIVGHYGGTPPPAFSGALNGFMIHAQPVAPNHPACQSERLRTTGTEHGSQILLESGLNYEVAGIASFTPARISSRAGADSGSVGIGFCGDVAVTVFEEWRSTAGTVEIIRQAVPPQIGGPLTPERLETSIINERPAVIVYPRYSGDWAFVYMRDERSIWKISSRDVDVGTLIRFAEGIR